MEYQVFEIMLYLRLGIILSLLSGITYCQHTPVSFSELFRSHRYITEAYFQKHDTLIDRIFKEFISSELLHSSCEKQNLKLEPSVIQLHLNGEGSHRRLISSIKIKTHPKVISELPLPSCEAIIIERLPSGVFADPFELEHLTARGVFSGASAFGDTDLELPTVRANRSVVEVHVDLSPDSLSGNKNGWELSIELPLHARYAPLGQNGYTRVEFVPPDLFVHCTEGSLLNQSCIFSSTSEGVISGSDSIVWEVPSGIVKHTKVVSVLTFFAAVVGTISVFMACIFYSETSLYNGSKQS